MSSKPFSLATPLPAPEPPRAPLQAVSTQAGSQGVPARFALDASSLPGLPQLLDGEAIERLLLQSATGPPTARFRLSYLRYKPGNSLLALYEAAAVGGPALWWTLKTCREERWATLAEKTRQFPEGRLCNALRLAALPFPADRRLRSLGKLATAEGRQGLAERLFGSSVSHVREVVPLHYKPERRLATCWSFNDGTEAVLKFHGSQFPRVRRRAEATQTLPSRVAPRLLAVSRSQRILAYRWLPGSTFRQLLDAPGQSWPDAFAALAETVADLHTAPAEKLKPRRGRAAALEKLAADLGHIQPAVAAPAQALATALARQLAEVLTVARQPAALHGDLSVDQVVAAPAGLALIDFDQACLGDPREDVGNLIAHLLADLERRKYLDCVDGSVGDRSSVGDSSVGDSSVGDSSVGDSSVGDSSVRHRRAEQRVEEAIAVFVQNYRRATDSPLPDLWRFAAASLFRLATHPFRYADYDGPRAVARILRRVQRILDTRRVLAGGEL